MATNNPEKITRGGEFLEDLIDRTVATLRETLGLDQDTARGVAEQLVLDVSDTWGGAGANYIPKGRSFRAVEVHRRIFAEFNGRNVYDLHKRYGFTVQHIYKIIREMRRAYIAERQGDLFGVQPGEEA